MRNRETGKFDEKEIVKRIVNKKLEPEETLRLLINTQRESIGKDYPDFFSAACDVYQMYMDSTNNLYKCRQYYENKDFRCCYLNSEGYCRKMRKCEWKVNANV